jgi:fructosamine-3-kinase
VSIEAAVERATGRAVASARRVGGGCINDGYEVTFEGGAGGGSAGRAFVKTRQDVPEGEYAAEAAGLRWLGEPAGAPRVPAVLGVSEEEPRLLALEWVDEGALSAAGAEELGRGLAEMHAAGAEAFGARPPGAGAYGAAPSGARPPGAPAPLRLGAVALDTEPLPDWPSFYARRLLLPLAREAHDAGSLSGGGAKAVERVCERIADLAGPPEPPARLHGDLWGGNVLSGADGHARLIDPAAYGGHREVDLAMLRLFGTPHPRVLAAYDEARPLAAGHEQRVGLWQLFPLLVHAVLFGGGYGASAERTARRYAG